MKCDVCKNEKKIERVNVLVYGKNVCSDCDDDIQNMKVANDMKERMEHFRRYA